MQQEKASSIVVVVEDGTHSEEDTALVVDSRTDYTYVWVLDSEVSYHICPKREWFSTYEPLGGGNLVMAKSSIYKVVEMGSIKISNNDSKLCTLNKVGHISHMTKNLISMSLLDNKGFSLKGGGGVELYMFARFQV
jgi:hypothetical protein